MTLLVKEFYIKYKNNNMKLKFSILSDIIKIVKEREVIKMKLIVTENKIISLENVKSVKMEDIISEKHTSKGVLYYLYQSSISIKYFGNDCEHISFKDYRNKSELEKDMKQKINDIITILTNEK